MGFLNWIENMMVRQWTANCLLLTVFILFTPHFAAAQPLAIPPDRAAALRAGAASRNIDPVSFPVWVSGGIVAGRGERVVDSLFARALVIEQEGQSIAICVVDSLGVPASIVMRAKEIVTSSIGIPADRILISATHSHSAPAVMGAHGTPPQEDYAEALPSWIAESILTAHGRMSDSQVGYTVTNAERFIHCRHWLMEPMHAGGVLFSGREGNIAMMNPGHDNPFKVRQTSNVDRTIPILSIQYSDGKPMALLASFCTHYAGAPALSSDYFGVVAHELAVTLRPDAPDEFVGIMANGTSGDANCIDFSRPAKPFTYREVGKYIAERIVDALPRIEYRRDATVRGALETITVNARVPDEAELKQAEAYVASRLGDRLPSNIEENYVRETVLLANMPKTRDLPLQALRVGNLVIAGYPNETFNATGLAVRSQSPFAVTMNIGLANDYEGYLPPADQFPLGGYTTWRARTSCLEIDAEAKVVEGVNRMVQSVALHDVPLLNSTRFVEGQSLSQTVEHRGPNSAVTPQDSLGLFELDPIQRIELVASEPQTIDPVAIRFDDAGDLWVVEMSDYPTNAGPGNSPKGRIRVLRDEDLDGVYESARTFADGLLFPTGLQFHRDAVLVTVGGNLISLKDTNGDGRADHSKDMLQGFAEENPQLRVNDPDFGIDNQLYLANGLRSARVQFPNKRTDSNTLEIGNSDLRLDLQHGVGQAVTGPSQFGMTWDRDGNRYFCSNRNPCDEVLLELSDAATSPLVGLAPMTASVLPAGEKSTVHPLVSAWTTSNLHAGQFTAACGVMLSDSDQLPIASLANALTCEPTGSLVHRVGLGRVNGRTIVEEPDRGREWLASRDPWFRPVNLEEGPDGAIYVVDMHRAVIEHPDWVPDELKHREDERWGEDCGRIYRVTRHDAPNIDPIFAELRARPLRSRTTEELVALLDHPREWVRRTVGRLLHERDDASAETLLIEFCKNRTSSPGFLRAVHLLRSREVILTELLTELLDTQDPTRTSISDPSLRSALWRLVDVENDVTLGVYFWAAGAIGSGNREEALACAHALAHTTIRDNLILQASLDRACDSADDPYVLMALCSLQRHQLALFTKLLLARFSEKLDSKEIVTSIDWPALRRLVAQVAQPESEIWLATREAWLERITKLFASPPPMSEADRRLITEPQMRLALTVANGIAASQDRKWLSSQTPLWDKVISIVAQSDVAQAIRLDGLELLGYALSDEQSSMCTAALGRLVTSQSDPVLINKVVSSWSKHNDPEFMPWVLDRMKAATPTLRTEMFAAIRSRPDRLADWLDAVEKDSVLLQVLDASQLQSLRQIGGDLQPRADRILEGRLNTNRQQVIERFTPCLERQPDLVKGKQVFVQHCSACHRIDGIGNAVGPDISDSRTQSPMQLLVSILDPNRAIDNNYFRVIVRMSDGTLHDGIVVEESAQHITLRNQSPAASILSKVEIDSIRSTGTSLMPDGIEGQIDEEKMADLVGYLKNWRYTGGESPKVQIP